MSTLPTRAEDIIRVVLQQYGLESLSTWAMQALARGLSETQVLQEMRQQPEFIARFPAIKMREEAGLAPISPAEYVEYERRVAQVLRDAGLPASFYDQPEDFTRLLVSDKSAQEVQSIIQDGYLRVAMAPPEVRAVFADWFGADGDSALAAFFLDPDRAKPVLFRMAEEATIGGTARRFDFDIGQETAQRIAEIGAGGQAEQVFAQLDEGRGYFEETITESTDLTAENEGVRAGFGLDGESRRAVRRRQEERGAWFGGAGTGGAAGTAEDYQRR